MLARTPLLSLLAALVLSNAAHAHKLIAEHRVLPDGRVQVEAWFETGDSPPGAPVKVYRADGTLLREGKLDGNGVFVFAVDRPGPLHVVVTDGAGHRTELRISADQFSSGRLQSAVRTAAACLTPHSPALTVAVLAQVGHAEDVSSPSEPRPMADRGNPLPLKEIVLGITFLLALAAFVIAMQNAKTLRAMKDALTGRSPEGR